MSILKKIAAQQAPGKGDKMFALVTGKSNAGKTTLAGSLPGKTLLIQVKGKEFGAETAKALATKNGNKLDVHAVSSAEELLEIGQELLEDTTYDNVYVDGITALTAVIAEETEIRNMIEGRKNGNQWQGYERINGRSTSVREAFIPLTYASSAAKPKNVFFTLAIRVDIDGEGNPEVRPEMKGKATYSTFTRPSPTILHVAKQVTENDGNREEKRILLTRDTGPYAARVNGLLDDTNPGIVEADLGKLFKLISGDK